MLKKFLNKENIYCVLVLCVVVVICYSILSVPISHKEQRTGVERTIYDRIIRGTASNNILNGFSRRDKRYIKKYKITWIDGILPININGKLINKEFLPPYHVVVFSKTKPDNNLVWIIIGNGSYRWIEFDKLDIYINTTKYGIKKIIKGDVSDISQVVKGQQLDLPSLKMYIILKNIIDNDSSFLITCQELLDERDINIDIWLDKILKNTIITPSTPEVDPYDENFYSTWKDWLSENNNNIKFSSIKLFEIATSNNNNEESE